MADRALAGIAEQPVTGHGMVTLDNVLMEKFTVHNNFLAGWHAGGVFVFVSMVLATGLALRMVLRREMADPLREVVATAAVAAVAFAQTAPGIYNRYYWLPLAFAVVLGVRSRAGLDPGGSDLLPGVPPPGGGRS